jgi:3-methylfumaryl-CoA hydratase
MGLDATPSPQDWIGRERKLDDVVTRRLLAGFRATLAPHAADFGDTVAPPGFHWCLTPDIADAGELGPDGHPTKGDFLPPVPLPRRMWAASDLRFLSSIREGDVIRRRSTIASVEEKQGRTGLLVFVTIRNEFSNGTEPLVEEDQTIVYRAAEATSVPLAKPLAPPDAPHQRRVAIDPVLLFRYSALTFNGHRIHYDAPYVTQVEHYPGLVIHGPLQATLLMNFAATLAEKAPRRFAFRGVRAATGAQDLLLCATPDDAGGMALEVRSADGHVTMKATAEW